MKRLKAHCMFVILQHMPFFFLPLKITPAIVWIDIMKTPHSSWLKSNVMNPSVLWYVVMRTSGATRRNQRKVLQIFLVIMRVGPSIRPEHFCQQIGSWSLTIIDLSKPLASLSSIICKTLWGQFVCYGVLAGHAVSSKVTQCIQYATQCLASYTKCSQCVS